ncbi:MAG: hypothetical protein J3K34DRAFT_464192 [Monoraphidium minutum]|nr:MAG: hypothetical protein J3K34DRAFT_464192 [Monoraphidium minutum]
MARRTLLILGAALLCDALAAPVASVSASEAAAAPHWASRKLLRGFEHLGYALPTAAYGLSNAIVDSRAFAKHNAQPAATTVVSAQPPLLAPQKPVLAPRPVLVLVRRVVPAPVPAPRPLLAPRAVLVLAPVLALLPALVPRVVLALRPAAAPRLSLELRPSPSPSPSPSPEPEVSSEAQQPSPSPSPAPEAAPSEEAAPEGKKVTVETTPAKLTFSPGPGKLHGFKSGHHIFG